MLDRSLADRATKVFREAEGDLKDESELSYIDDFQHEDEEEGKDLENPKESGSQWSGMRFVFS